jgi:hypothetical protein
VQSQTSDEAVAKEAKEKRSGFAEMLGMLEFMIDKKNKDASKTLNTLVEKSNAVVDAFFPGIDRNNKAEYFGKLKTRVHDVMMKLN